MKEGEEGGGRWVPGDGAKIRVRVRCTVMVREGKALTSHLAATRAGRPAPILLRYTMGVFPMTSPTFSWGENRDGGRDQGEGEGGW